MVRIPGAAIDPDNVGTGQLFSLFTRFRLLNIPLSRLSITLASEEGEHIEKVAVILKQMKIKHRLWGMSDEGKAFEIKEEEAIETPGVIVH
jgi:hypothetical protein